MFAANLRESRVFRITSRTRLNNPLAICDSRPTCLVTDTTNLSVLPRTQSQCYTRNV